MGLGEIRLGEMGLGEMGQNRSGQGQSFDRWNSLTASTQKVGDTKLCTFAGRMAIGSGYTAAL